MANRTLKDAKCIRGTNPQYLIEKIVRSRIYDSKFWKEECFALSAELIVDKAMSLRYIGGVFGGSIKTTPFLCLTLKMLQIQPEKDIVIEFIRNEEFKYVRALGAFYMRLVGTAVDIYKYLEPLLADSRKLRRQNNEGKFELTHMDEFVDELLRQERVCDVILPRLQKRHVLEESNELERKVSALDEDLEDEVSSDEEPPPPKAKSPVQEKPRYRSPDYERKERERERIRREREKEREREREREKERERERERRRERERERERERQRREREKEKREREKLKEKGRNKRDRGREHGRSKKHRK